MKTGLFFGSFNPIHIGHLIIAESLMNRGELDQFWFMVSPQNPFKKSSSLLGETDRLRMVEVAVEENFKFRASNFEFFLPKPSYTIDTLTKLKEKYPKREFSLIMGEDNLTHLNKWKNYEAILKYYHIYVYPRPGAAKGPLHDHPSITMFDLPQLDISATRIRKILKEGKSIRYLVSEEVRKYIDHYNLYGN